MPAGVSEVPLCDVLRLRVIIPGFFIVGVHEGLDGNFMGIHDADAFDSKVWEFGDDYKGGIDLCNRFQSRRYKTAVD